MVGTTNLLFCTNIINYISMVLWFKVYFMLTKNHIKHIYPM